MHFWPMGCILSHAFPPEPPGRIPIYWGASGLVVQGELPFRSSHSVTGSVYLRGHRGRGPGSGDRGREKTLA